MFSYGTAAQDRACVRTHANVNNVTQSEYLGFGVSTG